MPIYLDIHLANPSRLPMLVPLKRYILTLMLAMVLAALAVERRSLPVDPTPIVMMSGGGRPPRGPRTRPYRAHYRRKRERWAIDD